nr:MAG TPA: hypothetical protein [Caudoviricetes sp.]
MLHDNSSWSRAEKYSPRSGASPAWWLQARRQPLRLQKLIYISIIRVLVNKHVYKQPMMPYNQLMISFTFHHPHVLPR